MLIDIFPPYFRVTRRKMGMVLLLVRVFLSQLSQLSQSSQQTHQRQYASHCDNLRLVLCVWNAAKSSLVTVATLATVATSLKRDGGLIAMLRIGANGIFPSFHAAEQVIIIHPEHHLPEAAILTFRDAGGLHNLVDRHGAFFFFQDLQNLLLFKAQL